ncbi:hypothetical protein NPIL_473731 [Nephila pilipes]|uniref:Uncharacterized protein n=1 Tax=Nephila pilipes TaxID=299642 RepID=A0A8X6N1S2_NEPPI|nr:hypothetical protein NPIL_473731 [Nephila pilipes]
MQVQSVRDRWWGEKRCLPHDRIVAQDYAAYCLWFTDHCVQQIIDMRKRSHYKSSMMFCFQRNHFTAVEKTSSEDFYSQHILRAPNDLKILPTSLPNGDSNLVLLSLVNILTTGSSRRQGQTERSNSMPLHCPRPDIRIHRNKKKKAETDLAERGY